MKKAFLLLVPLVFIGCSMLYKDSLLSAARSLDYEKVKEHVEAGADLNQKDYNGFTPLIMAAYYGNASIVEYLCEAGAGLNSQDDEGWTALHHSTFYQHQEIVPILLEHGASTTIKDKRGYDVLWYAKRSSNMRILEMLENPGKKIEPDYEAYRPQLNATYGNRIDGATIELVRTAVPLKQRYRNINIKSFGISKDLKKTYPEASTMCKNAIIEHLRRKDVYASVTEKANPPYFSNTVLVDGQIENMYAANTAARVVFGPLVGTPIIDVRISLTDSDTKAVIHQKVISTTVNAWHAGWNMGTSDKYLAMGMGEIIGEYLYTILPAQP